MNATSSKKKHLKEINLLSYQDCELIHKKQPISYFDQKTNTTIKISLDSKTQKQSFIERNKLTPKLKIDTDLQQK